MKNLLLAAFFSLFFVNTSAFNYKPIRLGSNLLFSTYDSFGFLEDSLAIEGNDTTIYPKPVFFRLGDGRYPLKSTPLGKYIIQKANGDNFIITRNDTFLIRSNTQIGRKWVMHKSSTDIVLWAEVTSISSEKILGIMEDSVKTIKLTYTGDASSFYKWNGKQLKISKNFGLISAFSFEEFPTYFLPLDLKGITNPSIGEQNLTWKEVWGMDVGDEIHIEESAANSYPGSSSQYYSQYWTAKKYLKKWTLGDTTFFKIERYTLDSTQNGKDPYIVKYRHDTIIERIDPLPEFDNYPGVYYLNWEMYRHNMGSTYEKTLDGTPLCNEGEYGYECVISDGGAARIEYFYKNLGGPYYQYGNGFGGARIHCVYSKIKGVESGTRMIFTSIQPHFSEQFASITALPIRKELSVNVASTELPAELTLYGLDGKTVLLKTLVDEKSTISLNSLKVGIYLYKLQGSSKQMKKGKIVLR